MAALDPYEIQVKRRATRMKNNIWNKNAILVDRAFITKGMLCEMIMDAQYCPCCGVRYESRCLTIDRVVPGNVQILCWGCNQVKSNRTLEQLQQVCAYIEKHRPDIEPPAEPEAFNATRFRRNKNAKAKGM